LEEAFAPRDKNTKLANLNEINLKTPPLINKTHFLKKSRTLNRACSNQSLSTMQKTAEVKAAINFRNSSKKPES
jgi:hypothetical protein